MHVDIYRIVCLKLNLPLLYVVGTVSDRITCTQIKRLAFCSGSAQLAVNYLHDLARTRMGVLGSGQSHECYSGLIQLRYVYAVIGVDRSNSRDRRIRHSAHPYARVMYVNLKNGISRTCN